MKVTGKLENGFEYEIDDAVLDDMEMVDALSEAQSTNPLALSTVINKLLGNEQKKALYDAVRREDGTVPIEDITQSVVAIFQSIGDEGKN
jgi:hypothetical protein